ncbi:molybdenum cofactor biosynthesis protein MoaE [Bauldia sp.]|uniref:molybdenum cofactor biosynthesis protein MoaE n=1 Tax=Bauldia sp. TaxID=2575872 RepID=UPI003BAD5397
MARIDVRVQGADFDTAAEIDRATRDADDVGAVVTFTGRCRGDDGRLTALEIEHYAGMAEAEIRRIAETAAERWPVNTLTVIHRHGLIPVGDNIVLVVATSRRRQAAFSAADFLMDYLKTSAPFWKKEHSVESEDRWVEARAADDDAAGRWSVDRDEDTTP